MLAKHICLAFAVLRLAFSSQALLFSDPTQLTQSEYDFIIVGAGTAGNVIASRLTENPSVSVLLIEAGGDDAGVESLQLPLLASGILTNSSLIWNYTTVPQIGLDNRTTPIQRGKVLGGSSSINFLIYTRGSRDDYDRYAELSGDSGWSWDEIFPFMIQSEGFTAPQDGHNTSGQFNPSAHGFNGGLLVTLPNAPVSIDSPVIETTKVDPATFTFNLDMNSGDTVGVGWTQSTTGGGKRSSSSTAFLRPVLNRFNLDVLINTQVTRVLPVTTSGINVVPSFKTVEIAQNATGPRTTFSARKEVILSAGAINTPQILMLSGVGNSTTLKAHGIKTLVNSPGVGQNLMDHPLLTSQFSVSIDTTLDPLVQNATVLDAALALWSENFTGPLSIAGPNQVGWIRLPSNSSIFQEFGDPAAGPTSGHMEILPVDLFSSYILPSPSSGTFVSATLNVANPLSRGTVALNSTDPFDFPLIDPAYLTHPLDLATMVEALRTFSSLVHQSPWAGIIEQPFGVLVNTSQASLEDYARSSVTTFWHPAGTAKMGKANDPTAVVNSKLLLKGADCLRIVDASVLPVLPAAHPQAAVYAFAERASSLIQAEWGI